VRADRYRLLQGLEEGNNVGGHEFVGNRVARLSNFFPNRDEYTLRDSLASWYRILIVSSHVRHSAALEEQDAAALQDWWDSSTGTNGGDRCILATGDDFFNYLLNSSGEIMPRRISLSQQVFGVDAANDAWSGTNVNQYPLINDQFSTETYLLDGGCPNLSRFDALTKIGSGTAANIAFYPGATQVAGVDQMTEMDAAGDNDRNKALGYGFSLQFSRRPGSGPSKPGSCCAYGGLPERLRLLYLFLTSCRGGRTSGQTTQCWPCPADTTSAGMFGNWASNSGFQTATYGLLYPIQDPSSITAVEERPTSGSSPFVNYIGQNEPNPFNPETVIPYTLAVPGRVTIRIFDVAGRSVRVLVDAPQSAGPHTVPWTGETDSGSKAASGVYFYKITYPGGATSSKRMTILR
jgi:FlgD Ig-like domain